VDRLQAQLDAATATPLRDATWSDRWCASTRQGYTTASALGATALTDVVAAACDVELRAQAGSWKLRADAASGRWEVRSTGEWEDVAADDEAVEQGRLGVQDNDIVAVLTAIPDGTQIDVVLRVQPGDEGLSWVRTRQALTDILEGRWRDAATLLGEMRAPRHLVIADYVGVDQLRCPGLVIHGLEVWPEDPADCSAPPAADAGWRSRNDDLLPTVPTSIIPMGVAPTAFSNVDLALRQVAGALSWWPLMLDSSSDGAPAVRIAGDRVVTGAIEPCPPEAAQASVDLWSWASGGAGSVRWQAVERTAALQVRTVDELYLRAASILRTAKFLVTVAESDLIQEALSARRDARSAAIAAARTAADRARATVRSTVDRVLVAIAGGVAIVLANRGALVGDTVAYLLVALVAAIAIAAAGLALGVEIPGARRGLAAFRKELPTYEVLSTEDAAAIEGLPSLTDAEAEIDIARRSVWVLMFLTLLVVVGLSVGVSATEPASTDPTPAPSTTTGGP
jgi:hypothetical protein